MTRVVILSGAGISAESGVKTFRDSGGLWENHRVEDVATPQAFARNPALVLDFYNKRRAQLADVVPNAGHLACKELEAIANVHVITQNVDDLHERAGSSNILHLHGELTKARPSKATGPIIDIGYRPIQLGELAQDGSQLRPHIVWFGEAVPMMDEAIGLVQQADLLIVVGTSLQVYPAAGLVYETKPGTEIIVVDPSEAVVVDQAGVTYFNQSAAVGMPKVVDYIKRKYA